MVPEIWAGQNRGGKKKKKEEKKMNIDKTIKHPLRGSLNIYMNNFYKLEIAG